MKATNGWMGEVFGVAGLNCQGALRAQRRNVLVLRVTPTSVAQVYCHENGVVRKRLSAKCLKGTPTPVLQTYNPL